MASELGTATGDTPSTQSSTATNQKSNAAAATILDMGNYLLSECRNRPYTAEDAALPPIAGEHVVQVLPQDLLGRAALFPTMDPASQVSCLTHHVTWWQELLIDCALQ